MAMDSAPLSPRRGAVESELAAGASDASLLAYECLPKDVQLLLVRQFDCTLDKTDWAAVLSFATTNRGIRTLILEETRRCLKKAEGKRHEQRLAAGWTQIGLSALFGSYLHGDFADLVNFDGHQYAFDVYDKRYLIGPGRLDEHSTSFRLSHTPSSSYSQQDFGDGDETTKATKLAAKCIAVPFICTMLPVDIDFHRNPLGCDLEQPDRVSLSLTTSDNNTKPLAPVLTVVHATEVCLLGRSWYSKRRTPFSTAVWLSSQHVQVEPQQQPASFYRRGQCRCSSWIGLCVWYSPIKGEDEIGMWVNKEYCYAFRYTTGVNGRYGPIGEDLLRIYRKPLLASNSLPPNHPADL